VLRVSCQMLGGYQESIERDQEEAMVDDSLLSSTGRGLLVYACIPGIPNWCFRGPAAVYSAT